VYALFFLSTDSQSTCMMLYDIDHSDHGCETAACSFA
jgi:hypothetical protein